MRNIRIADTTLCRRDCTLTFKEKIEIGRQLEMLGVNVIELPEIEDERTDILLIKTMSSLVKKSTISVAAGSTAKSIENAAMALVNAANPSIRIELPVSTVCMEYQCHKKPAKMLDWIKEAVAMAGNVLSEQGHDNGIIEFCAVDATRAEKDFLKSAIEAALEAGAEWISICDSTGEAMPDEFAEVIKSFIDSTGKPIGVLCSNKNSLASAQAILSVKKGVDCVKTAVGGDAVELKNWADMIKNCGNDFGFSSDIDYTRLHRICGQIERITSPENNFRSSGRSLETDNTIINLDNNSSMEDVSEASSKLGYDLSEEDRKNVYEQFKNVAAKKKVGAKDLDAIIASASLQVPQVYSLENFVVMSSNAITSSAQISLTKDNSTIQGISIGDGAIDASFKAIEQCIGCHYDLDDFQIFSVTEGQEAVGRCVVKLISRNKVYSGSGISTDIIGASIRAYISAVNKIVYEEA